MRLASLRLLVALVLVLGIASCGGGGSSNKVGEPAKVTLAPTTVSLTSGQFTSLAVLVQDAKDVVNRTADVTFAVTNEKNAAGTPVGPNQHVITVRESVDANGSTIALVCAGNWESNGQVCNPNPVPTTTDPTTIVVGTAQITATAGAITSAATSVNTHPQIGNLTLTAIAPVPACLSQNGTTKTQQYQAKAFDVNGNDITGLIGTINYSSSDPNVATINISTGLATAKRSGRANIFAAAAGVNSPVLPFTTCSPANIFLASANTTPPETSFTLAAPATKQLTAVATDTLGIFMNDPGLTFFSTAPSVATVNALTGVVTAVAAGSAKIIAACAPPSCNNGTGQTIFSNVVDVTVSGTLSPRVYATGRNSTTIVPIDPATNTAGTAITIPTIVPNGGGAAKQPTLTNAMFSPDGSRLYIGSDTALIIFDPGTNTVVASNNVAIGKVLAVAPNQTVAVADPNNTQVRLFAPSSGTVTATLAISNATAAAFTPDSGKVYITHASGITAFSPFATIQLPTNKPPTDMTVLNQGSVAYVARPDNTILRPISTCDNEPLTDIVLGGDPLFVRATEDSSRLFAVDGTNIYEIGVTLNSIGCPPSVTHTSPVQTSFGVGPFVPRQLIVSQSGTKAFVLSNLANVLAYDATTDTPTTIPLAGGATSAFSGGVLPDASNVYVGTAGTNDVHRINVATGTDAQQIAVNLKDKNNAATTPDIVVVKPR